MKKGLITALTSISFLLSGCNFINNLIPSSSDSEDSKDEISSFEFVTDSNLVLKDSGDSAYYLLTIYVGDTYQIHTNIDDKLEDKYHFVYEDVDNGYEVSSDGVVTAKEKCVENFRVRLIRNKDSKKIAYKSIIINIKDASSEYANISINDPSLPYDEETRTYSLTLTGGMYGIYFIETAVRYNVPFIKTFELAKEEFSSFMSVSQTGLVTANRVDEDKDGQVIIRTLNEEGSHVYDTVYLNVHVNKSDEPVVENKLVVSSLDTGILYEDGDEVTLILDQIVTFDIEYNETPLTNVMSVSNPDVLRLENSANKITCIEEGKSNLTFAYEDKSITIEIEVYPDNLEFLDAKNGGDDFVIVNGKLLFLGRMFAIFDFANEKDITNDSNLTYVISNKDETYKKVTFTYVYRVQRHSVSYDVKYFNTEEYVEKSTAFTFSDYYYNTYRGNYYVLPNEGRVHMLVIPVWFNNSASFFRENQKDEILEDLEYVFNSPREKDDYYSVKQYFETESDGKVTMDITISEFYDTDTSSKIYGDTVDADILRTRTLADNALTWYFNNHSEESLADYDANNDGLVDAVSLVYAANYYGTIGDSNGTTAFQFKNSEGNTHKYNNGSFSPLGGIYGFSKGGNKYGKDVTDLSSYYPSYFFKSGGKTIIHETSHMFGFIDMYEDNHAETKYYPAGRFSMQSSNYGAHDPYQMNLIGWSKPTIYSASDYEVGETVTVKLNDFATSGNNILLTRDFNEYNSLFDEYMLLELLAPTGLNYFEAKNSTTVGFNEAGIRLWHVNSILENLSDSGKETSNIPNNSVVNLKYSNNDQSSPCDLAHWIRNNEEEPYDTVSTVKDSYGLFKTGDSFDMNSYASQFINPSKLDNKEKLGWEFSVDLVYKTIDENFGAIITLTRVDDTRTDFDFSSRIDKDIEVQPTEDGNDYAKELFGDDESFSLVYNFNDAVAPSYYTQGKPISYKGLCLFADPSGNGGSLVITIKDKEGYKVSINSISVTHTMLTNASLTGIVDGEVVEGTSFTGPYNDRDGYNEKGLTFEVNSNSITLQNRYAGEANYWSVLALYSISIDYHIEKI